MGLGDLGSATPDGSQSLRRHKRRLRVLIGWVGATLLALLGSYWAPAAWATGVDGTVAAWGYDFDGQATVPSGLSGVTAISAGLGEHNLALRSDGRVASWGDNAFGESTVPADLSGVTALSAGGSHSLALVSSTLVGSAQIQPSVDSNPAGTAEAFRYTASRTGQIQALGVYLDAGSSASRVEIGLYASSISGEPGKLLTSGTISTPIPGTWNTVRIPTTAVTGGAQYWLAVLAPTKAGMVRFRDLPDGYGGRTQTSAQTALKTLPTAWLTGHSYANAPASLVAEGGGS